MVGIDAKMYFDDADPETGTMIAKPREVTGDEIITANELANAHTFTTRLPEGYDHMLGERGAMLSKGQKETYLHFPSTCLQQVVSNMHQKQSAEVLESDVRRHSLLLHPFREPCGNSARAQRESDLRAHSCGWSTLAMDNR